MKDFHPERDDWNNPERDVGGMFINSERDAGHRQRCIIVIREDAFGGRQRQRRLCFWTRSIHRRRCLCWRWIGWTLDLGATTTVPCHGQTAAWDYLESWTLGPLDHWTTDGSTTTVHLDWGLRGIIFSGGPFRRKRQMELILISFIRRVGYAIPNLFYSIEHPSSECFYVISSNSIWTETNAPISKIGNALK